MRERKQVWVLNTIQPFEVGLCASLGQLFVPKSKIKKKKKKII